MPWPENKKVGEEIENIVKSVGAVPATIAIMNGQVLPSSTFEWLK